ncbi:MAG: cobalamin-dependent protein, partial [Deltaproteobacteria bacterium]|nr:cobalamin-dependent protein [Deltaproteobacteria bacterium]
LGTGHQIPLGLLMVGGPLLDAGHEVKLLDAERQHLSIRSIVKEVKRFSPQIVMTGHAGSTPAHPVCVKMLAAIKRACSEVVTVYGGVYPTFHAEQILRCEDAIDVIVRGEGEAISLELVEAIESGGPLHRVKGIAYRSQGKPTLTSPRPPISNLDAFRIAWELIENWDDYQCFGLGRAAIIQFSRGCPHCCTYCGQRDFWVEWRYRDPVKVVDEIEWLYRTHNVRFLSLADENPTSIKSVWQRFLEELASRELPVYFFASIRATDIVRDTDILHLYKQAGIQYILLGIESMEPEVIKAIKKGSTTRHDLEACRLLKQHGIFSIVAHVVGLKEETWKTFSTSIEQLVYYNGDFVNVTHVTPHSWTAFGQQVKDHPVVQPDLSKWDYRHQILSQRYLSPWKIFLAVKWLELYLHVRPGKLWEIFRTQDRFLRRQLLWTFSHTGLVWFGEVLVGLGKIFMSAIHSSQRIPKNLGECSTRLKMTKGQRNAFQGLKT